MESPYEYNEFPPSPRLAPYVECFWTLRFGKFDVSYKVLPDGCTDILFSRESDGASVLQVIGTMTQHKRVTNSANRKLVGIRFRPGMAHGFLSTPISEVTDQIISLDDLWGSRATQLNDRLSESTSLADCIETMEAHLDRVPSLTPVQRAIGSIVRNQGQISVEELAREANLSPRQFNRLCLEQAGVTPKRLCRILRFRATMENLGSRQSVNWAQLAADCGYYDQAHLIHEIREFTGQTPQNLLTPNSEDMVVTEQNNSTLTS